MREDLDALLRETTLVTIAFAIGFGMALYYFAQGFALFFEQLLGHRDPDTTYSGSLSWVVGRRELYFDGIFEGLVMLAVVTAAAMFVRRRRASGSSEAA